MCPKSQIDIYFYSQRPGGYQTVCQQTNCGRMAKPTGIGTRKYVSQIDFNNVLERCYKEKEIILQGIIY